MFFSPQPVTSLSESTGCCDVRAKVPYSDPWRHIQGLALQMDKLHKRLPKTLVCSQQWLALLLQVSYMKNTEAIIICNEFTLFQAQKEDAKV